MSASQSQPSVPESIRILSVISDNIAQFCKPGRRSLNERKSNAKQIAPLLDALTFFLPTIPSDGRVYAMTLAINGKEVIATIAANDTTHLDPIPSPPRPDGFPENQHSPRNILETVWKFMITLATGNMETASLEYAEMLKYLFRVHSLKIRRRFEKRSKEFNRFWTALSADKIVNSASSSKEKSVTASSREENVTLSCENSAVTSPSGETDVSGYEYAQTSDSFKSYLDAAKIIFDSHQAFYDTNDVTMLISNLTNPDNFPELCGRLEKLFILYDRRYLTKIYQTANPDKKTMFDLTRYISKLSSPLVHIQTIADISTTRTFKPMSELLLRTIIVENPPSTRVKPSAVSPELVDDFLRNAYVPSVNDSKDNSEYLELAINARTSGALKRIIPISTPHCECLLVRHHELADSSVPRPFPYVGVSKLSCFQCGIYLDAYNDYAEQVDHTIFLVKGRRNDIVPCLLPTISQEDDTAITGHMMRLIRNAVTAILNEDITKLKLHRLSQSTSGVVSGHLNTPLHRRAFTHILEETKGKPVSKQTVV